MNFNTHPKIPLLIFFSLLCFSTLVAQHKHIEIEKGMLYISSFDSEQNLIIDIEGEALFAKNQFFTDSIGLQKAQKEFIHITNSWNNQKAPYKNHSKLGFGTYYFRMKLPSEWLNKPLILMPQHFISYASEIYINNKLVANNGTVGKSADDPKYSPSRKTQYTTFTPQTEEVDVFINVSNFHHFRGGIFNTLKLGLAENMIEARNRNIFFDLLVVISLLIMFLYHFVIYFLNIKDKVPFYFSITCLVFAMDFSFQDTMSFFLFFPNISFVYANFLHLTMPYLIAPAFVFFLYALYPNETSKRIRNISGLIAISMTLVTAFGLSEIQTILAKPHYAYIILIVIYIYIPAIKAIKNKRESAKLFLFSYFLFSICAVNDLLFVFEIIHSTSLVSTGLIIFVFLLSILQGRRISIMFLDNLKLADNLKKANLELEEKVSKRTAELAFSLEKLKELGIFKDDMVSMIVHDLKNPLNAVLNLSRNNKVKLQAHQMLNLVNNILDIQKFEEASIKLEQTKFPIIEALNKSLEELKIPLAEKNISIVTHIRTDTIIKADKLLITRVLSNLISNALKYSPSNSKILIETSSLDQHIKVVISDSGIGISPENQNYIFDKFGQIKAKNIGHIRSTGLGLNFCKLSIEAHGGKIGVHSDGKNGSTFWFTITGSYENNIKSLQPIEINTSTSQMVYNSDNAKLINELKNVEFYEISRIRSILQTNQENDDAEFLEWKQTLINAAASGNKSLYLQLLKRDEHGS